MSAKKDEMVELKVEGVGADSHNQPVVILRDSSGKRSVPIWIGPAEAVAISVELEGQRLPRPMTHDLIRNILSELQIGVAQVVISEVRGGTYYARLVLQTNGMVKEIDCRPSDGIAIALRVHAPIFIPDRLLIDIEAEREEQKEGSFLVDDENTTVH